MKGTLIRGAYLMEIPGWNLLEMHESPDDSRLVCAYSAGKGSYRVSRYRKASDLPQFTSLSWEPFGGASIVATAQDAKSLAAAYLAVASTRRSREGREGIVRSQQ
jgi:hypothetical protein